MRCSHERDIGLTVAVKAVARRLEVPIISADQNKRRQRCWAEDTGLKFEGTNNEYATPATAG